MNNEPLLQQALGDDWYQLPTVIQRHYQLGDDQQTRSELKGVMKIDYPAFIRPILLITRLMGALIDLKGEGMQVCVEKWVTAGSSTLHWKRSIQASDGRSTVFASRMEYVQGNELIEYVGCGFGLRLRVSVDNGRLVYRSHGHLWQLGAFRIPIADVLFLGHATIIETAVSDHEFELDFRIDHPLFGETYRYGGIFHEAFSYLSRD